jgi:predicted 3-demethylubiquinone-9 3-methyltransferase (glyoxalase superfamily)
VSDFLTARRPQGEGCGKDKVMSRISPFLWFDDQAEEAANLYVSLFPNSKITNLSRYGEAGPGKSGSVMTVSFELDGLAVTALNGGPVFKLSEAFSMSVDCADQAEVDRYWDALIDSGGQPSQCGWLKDRFGLSWQIVPRALPRLLGDPDRAKAQRVMAAMLKMRKLDVAALEAAAEG